jgi:hypothetical protein
MGQQQAQRVEAWYSEDVWFAGVWNPVAGQWVRVPQPVSVPDGEESRQFEAGDGGETEQASAHMVYEGCPNAGD